MANGDDQQRTDSAQSRVYKASDVHKRRVDRKARPEKAKKAEQPAEEAPDDKPAQQQEPSAQQSFSPHKPSPRRVESRRPPLSVIRGGKKAGKEQPAQAVHFVPESARPGHDAPAPGSAGDDPAADAAEAAPAQAAGEAPSAQAEPGEGPAEEQGQGDAPGKAEAPAPEGAPSARKAVRISRPKLKTVLVVVAVVMGVLLVACAALAWNRWLRYDDHADMVGEWYVAGTTVAVSIDEEFIHLADDVAYDYEIDPQAKTISYTFGPMAGKGRYWFSGDRSSLVITDGDGFTAAGTAADDLAHAISDGFSALTGQDVALPLGDGVIALRRVPDPWMLAVERIAGRAKQASDEQKAKEERAREEAGDAAAEEEAEQYYYYYYEEPAADWTPGFDEGAVPPDGGADMGWDQGFAEEGAV